MAECPKSPNGTHLWVSDACIWCGAKKTGVAKAEKKTVQEQRYETETLTAKPVFQVQKPLMASSLRQILSDALEDEEKAIKEYIELAEELKKLVDSAIPSYTDFTPVSWAMKVEEISRDEQKHLRLLKDIYVPSQWPWQGFILGVGFIDLRGKTKRELFDLVKDKTNWKYPTIPIRVGSRKYADIVKEAIIYYVGGAEEHIEPPKGTITVTSKGYYFYIGS